MYRGNQFSSLPMFTIVYHCLPNFFLSPGASALERGGAMELLPHRSS